MTEAAGRSTTTLPGYRHHVVAGVMEFTFMTMMERPLPATPAVALAEVFEYCEGMARNLRKQARSSRFAYSKNNELEWCLRQAENFSAMATRWQGWADALRPLVHPEDKT